MISKCFTGHPENLWITLLKTCPEGLETLKNQGFAWIAYQMGIGKLFNEINDLCYVVQWPSEGEVEKLQKVGEPNFVHKSRGQAVFFEWKPGLAVVFVTAEAFGFQTR